MFERIGLEHQELEGRPAAVVDDLARAGQRGGDGGERPVGGLVEARRPQLVAADRENEALHLAERVVVEPGVLDAKNGAA